MAGNWCDRAQRIIDSDDFERRVAQLAKEAALVGDTAQVDICEQALVPGREGSTLQDIARHRAREQCAMVFAALEALSV